MGENSMIKKILLLVSFFFLIFISSCSSNNTETVRLRIIAASDNQNDIKIYEDIILNRSTKQIKLYSTTSIDFR